MKTKEEIQSIVDEINAICQRHGVVIWPFGDTITIEEADETFDSAVEAISLGSGQPAWEIQGFGKAKQ